MKVPVGFLSKLWSFMSFLPFFFLLIILGLLKAAIIGPIVVGILLTGNSAVVIGLWPAHFIWTYYCVTRTKKMGLVLKILVLVLLPVPLVLWAILGIVGSLLAGTGYGFFAPLIATFEGVGQNVTNKCYHCFVDGCLSPIKGSCMAVQDFTDFCFHSYFSYMGDLTEKTSTDEKAMDIKLSILPHFLLVGLIGVVVDVPMITAIALWKSPYMLFKGWKRLLEDLIGREGPFLETVCVPFAGLAILLWPLAVIGAVISAIIASFFLGFYGGIVVLQMGFSYIISVGSLFDEYVNDLLYLREGSCLPRPRYRRNMSSDHERKGPDENDNNELKNRREDPSSAKIVLQQSRTLRWPIQEHKAIQVWDWLFKSCEVNGRILLHDGLISTKEIEECLTKGNCKKLGIKLPGWSILQCLLASAKFDSSGLVITEDVKLARINGPRDKVFDWFIEPLFIMKEQLKKLQLDDDEEICLRKLVTKSEDWDDIGYPSNDKVRRAELQAIIRRLPGIVASLSRIPTFRRHFRNLVKILYIEALEVGASANPTGGALKAKYSDKRLNVSRDGKDKEEKGCEAENKGNNDKDFV